MEEDIEILEEFIKIDRDIRSNSIESDYDKFCERRCIAISNVLSRLKQLEEENKQLESIKDEAIRRYNFESIPKSKVKEILEKEELPLVIVGGRRNRKTLEYGRKLGRIETCKELLGEE